MQNSLDVLGSSYVRKSIPEDFTINYQDYNPLPQSPQLNNDKIYDK